MDDERGDSATSVGEALKAFLASRGLLESSREELCALLWREVAGEWYSRHCYVTSVRDGVCNVRCDSAPRAQQLQLDAPQIIERLNERLGVQFVAEIRASSAGIGDRPRAEAAQPEEEQFPSEEELDAIPVPPEEVRSILEVTSELEGEVRRRLEEILLRRARAEIWKREQGYRRCPGCGVYHRDSAQWCLACRPPERPTQAGGEEGLSAFFDPD
ncbi:MAG: DUF721 domain-containing protein [Armatimonadota bacterium]|nr:DUF721 domain-containing protein [Armatimonadota bacterium]